MSLPARDPESVARRTRAIAQVLAGRPVDTTTSLASFTAAVAGGNPGLPVDAPLDDDSKVAVGFDRAARHWALNAAVTRNTESAAPDVGAAAAEAAFRQAVESLATEGVIQKSDYDLGAVTVRTLKAGVGGPDGQRKEWVKEYFFTAPRKVEGIEVLDAGLEIAVHRNGSPSRVFVGGPDVSSEGARFSQTVAAPDLDARFATEFPNARVYWSGVRYIFSGSEGLSRPRQVYKFSRLFEANGRQVESRAQFAAYSLESATEAATVWPKHDPNRLGGDRRPGG